MAVEYNQWCQSKGINSNKAIVLQGVDAATYSKGTVKAHLKSLEDGGKLIDHRKSSVVRPALRFYAP